MKSHLNIYLCPESIQANELIINKIIISDTIIKKPQNDNTIVHLIDLYYNNQPILIQLSKNSISEINKELITIKIDNDIKNYLIKPFEEHISNILYSESENIFGKKFTLDKIIKCIISPLQNNLLQLSLYKYTKLYNRYKKEISIDEIIDFNKDLTIDIICLIKIANLQFINNQFTYNIILEQAKCFMDDSHLINYSIIDKSSKSIHNELNEENLEGEYYKE